MGSIKKAFFLALVVTFATVADAQKKFLRDADIKFENGEFFSAIELYKDAYSRARTPEKKARIIFQIAECNRIIANHKQAEVWYRKAIKAQYDDPIAIWHLARALKQQGKYEEAVREFKKYQEEAPEEGGKNAEKAIEACELAKKWKDNPTRYEITPQVLLNSKKRDFAPAFYDSRNNALVFSSDREGSTGEKTSSRTGANFQDLFTSEQDRKGKWAIPEPLGKAINTKHHEGAAVLDSRRRTMYFTRCKFEKEKKLGCDLMKAEKSGKDWEEPKEMKVKPEDADSISAGHPAIGFRDRVMVFASNMEGTKGDQDLWMMKYKRREKKWTEPKNLGSEINTPGKEVFPFIRENGNLYFASTGHKGMGRLDIFMAENVGENEEEDVEWKNVKNLKHPINSPSHDFGIVYNEDEDKGFFSSDRSGGKGQDDIYSFKIPPVIIKLRTKVFNKETEEPVKNATVKVTGTDGSSFEVKTDENGEFLFDEKGGERYIKRGTTYDIKVEKDSFLVATDKISTVDVEESTTFVKEFFIQPYVEEEPIEFPEVRYAYDSAAIQVNDTVNSKDSLDFLYDVLVDNPNIVIELMAHTDARGNDAYNEKLSQARAESCVEYLISKGIDSDRLVAKGYGESRPKVPKSKIEEMESEEKKESAHQKNRRTEFRVLREDYVPDKEGGKKEGSEQGSREEGASNGEGEASGK